MRVPCTFSPRLTFGSRPWWEEPQGPGLQLQLDSELEAELMLMRMRTIRQLLDPDSVWESLLDMEPSALGMGGTDWLRLPPLPEPPSSATRRRAAWSWINCRGGTFPCRLCRD